MMVLVLICIVIAFCVVTGAFNDLIMRKMESHRIRKKWK